MILGRPRGVWSHGFVQGEAWSSSQLRRVTTKLGDYILSLPIPLGLHACSQHD